MFHGTYIRIRGINVLFVFVCNVSPLVLASALGYAPIKIMLKMCKKFLVTT